MKKIKHNEELPEQMSDIASGKIFEVPPDYFENLSGNLFDSEGHLRIPVQRTSTIHMLRPWLIAASIALLVLTGWWLLPDNGTPVESFASHSELGEYIRFEIMEYDLEILSAQLDESDLYSITDAGADSYEAYIEENLDDFEEIIY